MEITLLWFQLSTWLVKNDTTSHLIHEFPSLFVVVFGLLWWRWSCFRRHVLEQQTCNLCVPSSRPISMGSECFVTVSYSRRVSLLMFPFKVLLPKGLAKVKSHGLSAGFLTQLELFLELLSGRPVHNYYSQAVYIYFTSPVAPLNPLSRLKMSKPLCQGIRNGVTSWMFLHDAVSHITTVRRFSTLAVYEGKCRFSTNGELSKALTHVVDFYL